MSWSAGLLLPAAGPASAPLPRVGAKQGSQGAIGWGATTLHLEVGSQSGVLAGAPVRGGQGIWKESRRAGLHRALGASRAPSLPAPPATEALCPVRTRQSSSWLLLLTRPFTHSFTHSFIRSFIHSSTHPGARFIHSPICSSIHSPIHSFIHSSTNANQGQAPGPAEVPGRDMETSPHKGTKGSALGGEIGRQLQGGRDPGAGPEAGAGAQEAKGPA